MDHRSELSGGGAAHVTAAARALVALRAGGEDLDDPRPRGAPDGDADQGVAPALAGGDTAVDVGSVGRW